MRSPQSYVLGGVYTISILRCSIKYVCVYHSRPYIFVAQQLLYGADIIASLDQMGGKAMA